MVYKMSLEDPGGASFAGIGGLGEQVRELREVCQHRIPLIIDLTSIYMSKGHRAPLAEP